MQPQKLCLKWNNHTVNLLSVLGSFQQKDILVDVTISCEGQNIKAHKMVLSACSPYFQNIFLENPCQHPIVIINGIKYEDITAILNFMYKGEVNVSQDGLSSFLQAAEALKVKGLAEVCGERKSTNSINQEAQHNEQNRPQRTDTPPRKKHRNRKRSLSDSNKSDDEGTARKHHREPSSPEIHELSGDESFTGDNTSNGPPFHSSPRVPQNIYSRSHQSSSNLGGEDDDDYEVEPSKLLEQTLTTETVSMNNSNSDNNLRIERIMGNATEIESSNIQEPESPPDIKPIIDYGESSAGPSDGNLMLYSEHSQPGPSSVQDGSLLHDNSHTQAEKSNRNISDRLKSTPKHMCETTRLLQEIKEGPVCFCHLNNTESLETALENELNGSSEKVNQATREKSKQLLIYNEEGCMKGIELEKDLSSDWFTISPDLDPTASYLLIEEDVLNDRFNETNNLQCYGTPRESFERSLNYASEPRYSVNTSSSDDRETHDFSTMPDTFSPYNVKRSTPVDKKRQRKSSMKSKSLNYPRNELFHHQLRRKSEKSTPQGKQAFTQISVEEVHVSEDNHNQRPQRSISKISASNILMLRRKYKRKIVQSTSIEFAEDIQNEGQFSVHKISKNGRTTSTTEETPKKKYTRSQTSKKSSEIEKYGPDLCPPGWEYLPVTRKRGKTAGQVDVYFVNPEGKRLRSKAEVAAYCSKNALPYSADEFCFKKSAHKSNMLTYK